MSWKQIDKHRKKAREIAFDILVWGPSQGTNSSYDLRIGIKKHFCQNGHSAKFSEDLINEGEVMAAPDIVVDEIFHADAANLIIVVYGSRGTQTELERILSIDRFARKSILVVNDLTWQTQMQTLTSFQLQNFPGEILKVPDDEFETDTICRDLDGMIEKLQFAEYYRKLTANFIKN